MFISYSAVVFALSATLVKSLPVAHRACNVVQRAEHIHTRPHVASSLLPSASGYASSALYNGSSFYALAATPSSVSLSSSTISIAEPTAATITFPDSIETSTPTTSYSPVPTTTSTLTATSETLSKTTSSSSSDVETGGIATYFYQEGGYGACGQQNPDSAMIAAITPSYYGDGGNCGRQIVITAPSTGQTITVTVADMCPGCRNANSIDLSIGAISSLAGSTDYTQEGIYDINWHWA